MISALPANALIGNPLAMALPKVARSGTTPKYPWAPAIPRRNPVITSSEDQQCAIRGAKRTQTLQEALGGKNAATIAHNRFGDNRRYPVGSDARALSTPSRSFQQAVVTSAWEECGRPSVQGSGRGRRREPSASAEGADTLTATLSNQP